MEELQKAWEDYLRKNPTEIIGAVALLLSHFNVSVTDEEETSTHGNESNTKQESRDPQAAEESNQDAEQD